jgi:phosphopantothenoylcysteine decarboxylase/phosphopantothenate--cysteine ligase
MTPASKDFVTPLTLSTLSKNPVYSSFYNEDDNPSQNVEQAKQNEQWNNHVELGLWADLMLIAPATANTLSKMVNGNCDNLLIATYLSAKCPVYFAPAMDLDMYKHPSTIASFQTLKQFGNIIIPAENGELASGLSGEGRMAEPENIIAFLEKDLESKLPLKGKKILVTAGPTYEAIDPVRFIGNHSSGKMGYAIAEAFYLQGANVTIVSGPTNIKVSYPAIKVLNVTTSDEMFEAVSSNINNADIAVMSAAVADYKAVAVASNKIKKKDNNWNLELEKTKDILHFIGNNKKPNQFVAGFALETENEKANAILKLKAKNADCIILNSFNNNNPVFGADENKITIIDSNETEHNFETKSKTAVANDIVSFIISKINNEKK